MSTNETISLPVRLPAFSRKTLSDAVERVANSIDHFQQRLNDSSADIKALENWLRAKNIAIRFSYEIESDDFQGKLHWVNYGDKEWRLCLMTYDYDIFEGRRIVSDNRPLIEMPIEPRLKAYKFLPEFILALRDHLDSTDAIFVDLEIRKRLKEEEIPF